MMMTMVFEAAESWWFRWQNIADEGMNWQKDGQPWDIAGKVLAQGCEGPFPQKEGADRAREEFKQSRMRKYPGERIE